MYFRTRRRISAVYLLLSLFTWTNCAPYNDTSQAINIENVIDHETEYEVQYNKKYGINPSWQVGNNINKDNHKYILHDEQRANLSNKTFNEALDKSVKNIINKNNTNANNTTAGWTQEFTTVEPHVPSIPTDSTRNTTKVVLPQTAAHEVHVIPLGRSVGFQKNSENYPSTTKFPIFNYNNTSVIIDNGKIEVTTKDPYAKQTVQISKAEEEDEVIEITDTDEPDPDAEDPTLPVYTDIDYESSGEVPEDYYDSIDVVPTAPPDTSAVSVLFGLAGSVAESVAERLLPKTIFDLYKRMQKQNEAIEADRLRSREENGGLGQFGRGILKSISSGITGPLSQLMAGARDIGSLDSDRGFVAGLASQVAGVAGNVANVAQSVGDAFKDRVQAIYPGTLWCGDGHSATARSQDLGLFFLTDTCCRQHDACKLFIRAGDTKWGLTNTGIFTRSHCACDQLFRKCLKKTSSLVSTQIGLTYFNVLGPQCFRKANPIVRCVRRTRITGQKCEEYELDFTKPKMWQWFDTETF